VLSRGFFVEMLRDGGHGGLVVVLVSSLMFAALHMLNVLGGRRSSSSLFC